MNNACNKFNVNGIGGIMKADYAIFMDFGLFSKILVEFFGSRKGVGIHMKDTHL